MGGKASQPQMGQVQNSLMRGQGGALGNNLEGGQLYRNPLINPYVAGQNPLQSLSQLLPSNPMKPKQGEIPGMPPAISSILALPFRGLMGQGKR